MTASSTLQSIARCAVRNGLTLGDINGNIRHWLGTCRDSDGNRPTSAAFHAAFEAEQLAWLSEKSTHPAEVIDDE